MSDTGHWQRFYDKARAAGSDDATARTIADQAQATLDRVRSAINGGWTRAEIISEALGSDILTVPSVRRRTIYLRDMPGADPNDSRSNAYVVAADVIAHLTETLP